MSLAHTTLTATFHRWLCPRWRWHTPRKLGAKVVPAAGQPSGNDDAFSVGRRSRRRAA
jgi:hypothetical protein